MERASISRLLLDRANDRPEALAYGFLADGERELITITYGELDRQARAIGDHLSNDLARGARAILLYPPGLEFIAAMFGSWYAGLIPVPAYPPFGSALDAGTSRLIRILRDTEAEAVLCSSDTLFIRGLVEQEYDDAIWIDTTQPGLVQKEGAAPGGTHAFDVALIQYTSGSTGNPKGVVLRHDQLLENQRAIQEAMGLGDLTVGVSWLPLYHDMGLIGFVIQPLYLGIPSYLMSPLHFLQRPKRWLDAISRFRGTCSGGPNFAYELCLRKISNDERETLDLSSWEVAFDGAEAIRAETLRRFAAKFDPCGFDPRSLYACYGLAEATLLVSGATPRAGLRTLRVDRDHLEGGRAVPAKTATSGAVEVVSCGRPPSRYQVEIVEPKRCEPVGPGEVGEIWVRGPSVADGYWKREAETRDTFYAAANGQPGEQFLRTGDLGFLSGGELFVTGRIKDLIIVRGRNVYPQDIEELAQQVDGRLRPGAGVAFSIDDDGEERACLVQETTLCDQKELQKALKEISRAVATNLDIRLSTITLIEPRSIPKTTSGKLSRYACRRAFLEGTLKTVAEWREREPSGEPARV